MFRLDAELVNTFVQPSLEIIEEVVPKLGRLKLGEVYIKEMKVSNYDITLSTMFSGHLDGRVLLSLPVDLAIEIAEGLRQTAVDSFDSEAQTAVVELMGMIVGNAGLELSDLHYNVKMTPVIFSYGTREHIGSEDCPCPVTVPLLSNMGTLELDLAFY